MAGTLANLLISIGVDQNRIRRDMAAVQSTVVGGLQGIRSPAMATMGRTMAGIGGIAVVGMAAAGVKMYAEFDQAMTEALAIQADVTDEMRKNMETAARAVARTSTFSASEAASAYFYLASAGMAANEQLQAMPLVAKFAQAGAFDLEKATELLIDAQSSLGMRIRDDADANAEAMQRVSDVIVHANNLSMASTEQFSEALTNKAGAAAKMYGKDVEEVVAVLSAYADTGVKGLEAGEKTSILWRDLQRSAIKNASEFDNLGISVFDVNGNMENTADIIEDLENALGKLSDREKRMALMDLGFQDRSVAALVQLLGSSGEIRRYENELREGAGGKTAEVAEKQLTSFSARWKMLQSNVADVAMTLGQSLVPILESVMQFITPIVSGIADFAQANEGLMKSLGPVVTLLGALAAFKFGKGFLSMMLPIPMMGTMGGPLAGTGSKLGGLFGKAFGAAALLAMVPIILEGLAQLDAQAQANRAKAADIDASTQKLLAEGMTREQAQAKIDALRGMAGGLSDVQQGLLAVGDIGEGNVLGSVFDIAFGANPAEVRDKQIREFEKFIEYLDKTAPYEAQGAARKVGDAYVDGLQPLASEAQRGQNLLSLLPKAVDQAADEVARGGEKLERAIKGLARNMGDYELADDWVGQMRKLRHEVARQMMGTAQTITDGMDNIKSALENPPKLMSRGARIKQYVEYIQKIDQKLKQAFKRHDDVNVAYWAGMKIEATQGLKEYRNTGAMTAKDLIKRFNELNIKLPKWLARIANQAKSKGNAMENSIKDTTSGIQANLDAQDWTSSGLHMTQTLAAGLDAGIPEVEAASQRVAAAAASAVKMSAPPKFGPLSKVREFMPHMIAHLVETGDRSLPKARGFSMRLGGALAPAYAGAGAGPLGRGRGRHAAGGEVHFHIGTLVADDRGLDELERRMGNRRRLRERNYGRYNEPG